MMTQEQRLAWHDSDEGELGAEKIRARLVEPLANDPRFPDLVVARKRFPEGKVPQLREYDLFALGGQGLAGYCDEATEHRVKEYARYQHPTEEETTLARQYYQAFGALIVDHLSDFPEKHPDIAADLNFMGPVQLTEFALEAFTETAIDLLNDWDAPPDPPDPEQIVRFGK